MEEKDKVSESKKRSMEGDRAEFYLLYIIIYR